MTYRELIDKDDLIKHLNTTMYRDVIEEIKNFPSVTPVIARQTNGIITLIPCKKGGEWRPLSLKTLNGDDIVAYESSCCRAIADKKYRRCPNCGEERRQKNERSKMDSM